MKSASYTRLCSTKHILTVNGRFPGPTLRAQRGDKMIIKVYNKGKDNITLHWYIQMLLEIHIQSSRYKANHLSSLRIYSYCMVESNMDRKLCRHGVKQPRNPWSDGPAYITQCPIQPGKKYTYRIHFTTEEGTMWWHAHLGWSRATVHGAIIIYPKRRSLYPFPHPHGEVLIILGMLFHPLLHF